MKDSIPIALCLVAACTSIVAQTPSLNNYAINSTGYSALFPVDPGKADVSLSEDELEVYSSEVEYKNNRYGLIMILLNNNFTNSDKETLEGLLVSYLEFLKLSYDITSSIGYINEQKHPTNPKAIGIQDFWEDETGAQWAVKGWIANDVLAVLYVHSTKPQDMSVPYEFLDGFSFKKPELKTEPVKKIYKRGTLK